MPKLTPSLMVVRTAQLAVYFIGKEVLAAAGENLGGKFTARFLVPPVARAVKTHKILGIGVGAVAMTVLAVGGVACGIAGLYGLAATCEGTETMLREAFESELTKLDEVYGPKLDTITDRVERAFDALRGVEHVEQQPDAN